MFPLMSHITIKLSYYPLASFLLTFDYFVLSFELFTILDCGHSHESRIVEWFFLQIVLYTKLSMSGSWESESQKIMQEPKSLLKVIHAMPSCKSQPWCCLSLCPCWLRDLNHLLVSYLGFAMLGWSCLGTSKGLAWGSLISDIYMHFYPSY